MARRFALWMLLLMGSFLLLLSLTLAYFSFKDYDEEFSDKKGKLADVTLEPAGKSGEANKYWLRLRGDSGLSSECGLLVPPERGIRYPAFIVLGGKATGKYAIDYALGVKNVIIIAPDYPYNPRESYRALDVLTDLPTIRQAIFDMVPSVELATDYLWTGRMLTPEGGVARV